jgi:hypothetical protein
MKKIFFASFLTLLFVACSSDSDYASMLEDEENAISAYISRNHIRVISSAPADGVWGENDYYLTSSGLYFHLVDPGEAPGVGDGTELYDGMTISVRHYKITLDAQPDTVYRNWTTADYPHPALEFQYNISGQTTAAFQEAISLMKNQNSIAKLIVPSKLGDQTDINAVIPYAYTLKINLED